MLMNRFLLPCILLAASLFLPARAEKEQSALTDFEARLQEKLKLIHCSNGITNLLEAVAAGNVEAVREHIHRGGDPNAKDELNARPLHYAAKGKSTEIVQMLLAAGANCKYKDNKGRLPLELCHNRKVRQMLAHTDEQRYRELEADDLARRGKTEALMSYLKKENISVNARSVGNVGTLLLTAVEGGHEDTFRALLEEGANITAVTEDKGYSALHLAAIHGHADLIPVLLEEQVDPMLQARDGSTALHEAVRHGHPEAIRALLPAYQEVNFSPEGGEPQRYPIYMAIDSGRDELVRAFTDAGFNPNDDRFEEAPPIVYATLLKRVGCVKLLVAAGAREFTRGLTGQKSARKGKKAGKKPARKPGKKASAAAVDDDEDEDDDEDDEDDEEAQAEEEEGKSSPGYLAPLLNKLLK